MKGLINNLDAGGRIVADMDFTSQVLVLCGIAMFMVGGGILVHGIHALSQLSSGSI